MSEISQELLASLQIGELPFDAQKFEGKLSAESFAYHHQKHHKAYVDNLAKFLTQDVLDKYGISSQDLATAAATWHEKNIDTVHNFALMFIVKKSFEFSNETTHRRIFNNAAQHWNHAFFWQSINPEMKAVSSGIAKLIEQQWGTLDAFKKAFYDAGTQLFGSGWVWLIFDRENEKLAIVQTVNAESPITTERFVPLLVVDVWEHAYYIDYRNRRVDYLDTIINQLDWEFAANNFGAIR